MNAFEGVHATIVELDQVDGGAAIQKELENRTGKATVPNVWLDGKFIGGSEEVLKGVEEGLFDKVEKGEIVVMEEEQASATEQLRSWTFSIAFKGHARPCLSQPETNP